jgi:ABC-type phosphate/phosphonate transport system substrate-binding protein
MGPLHQMHRPGMLAWLRVLAQAPLTPALPFVTSVSTSPRLVTVLRRVLTRLSEDERFVPVLRRLAIRRIVTNTERAYDTFREDQHRAFEQGYPFLF